jgi:HlyD family secretion protein
MKTLLKKTSGYKLPLIAILGLAFAFMTILGRKPTPAKEPIVSPPSSQYSNSIGGIGIIEPQSEVINIGTEISGIVRDVYVKVGQKIRKGSPLFSQDSRSIDAEILTLQATLEMTKVQENDANATYAMAQQLSDPRAMSKDEFNKRKYAAELARAAVIQTQAQLQQAITTKKRLTTRAPIDGEILSLNVRPGEFAAAGTAGEPLIRMGDTQTLNVRVDIDEEQARYVQKNAKAIAFKRGDTGHELALTFVRFEPYIRPKQNLAVAGQRVDTRVLQVIFAITDTDQTSFVGQQVDVFIQKETDK